MAHIKCRYEVPYCTIGRKSERIEHDEYWFCDSEDLCYDYSWRDHPAELKQALSGVINPVCDYCEYRSGEFEKDLKNYTFENGYLTARGIKLDSREINYLEIDGRVLIEEDPS